MTDQEAEQAHRQRLLSIHRQNLRILEQQRAQHGIDPPLHLLHAIEHEQTQIDALEGIERRQAPEPTRHSPTHRFVPHSRHWWAIGSIALGLLVAGLGSMLHHPEQNSALIQQLRADERSEALVILQIDTAGIAPSQITTSPGALLAVQIHNTSGQPLRWLLLDGNQSEAEAALGQPGLLHNTLRRKSPLLGPGQHTTLTFVPPAAGSYSMVVLDEHGQPLAWGLLLTR